MQDLENIRQLEERLVDIREGNEGKLDQDFYIYQWLKAANGDIDKAEANIRKSFEWRRENKIVGRIEDYPELEELAKSFPATIDYHLHSERPVCWILASSWCDMRRWVESGQKEQLAHFFALWTLKLEDFWLKANLEKMSRLNLSSMYEPSQFLHIFNSKKVQLKQFASTAVIQVVIQTLKNTASFFPPIISDMVFLNFSTFYYITLKVVQPFLKFLRLHVFDTNEEKWRRALVDKFVDHIDPSFLENA